MPPTFRTAAAICALAAGLAAAPPASAQEAAPLDPAEKAAIEEVVRDYLVENPEVIMEALTVLQGRQEQAARDRQAQELAALEDEIFDNPASPVIGNEQGDVTLVEFFDYQCGYCKSMLEPLGDLIAGDGDLRVVMKEFPVLGPASIVAARASLAAEEQGLYAEFHNGLMARRGRLDEAAIFAVAEDVGLDVERLKQDMESDAVADEIAANLRLAQRLGINGTPTFIVGEEIVPGAVDIRMLEDLIARQRAEG
ncbi:MAG TPA: DsbA family protein [Alphaproteobacteria bacterium]|nr:DsbA family protein [Alphaproteobacteria bacterium]